MIPDEKTCWAGGEHVWDASGVWCDKCGVFWPDGTGPMFIPTCHAEYEKKLANLERQLEEDGHWQRAEGR